MGVLFVAKYGKIVYYIIIACKSISLFEIRRGILVERYFGVFCKAFWMKKLAAFCLGLCLCLSVLADSSVLTANAKEIKTEYLIMVNRGANCVTVYEKDVDGEFNVPIKAFVCSCGREGHGTPLGTFKTSDYYEWRLMVDGTYGHYAVRFNNKIMFHSIPYYTKDAGNMEWDQFNLLGEPASLGCVRLTCADAKWIYDNCPKGTEVIVYDDAENPGPLGKPEEMKLTAENPMRMWDPTDTSSNNPWNQVRPTLYLTGAMGAEEVLMLPLGASEHDIYNAIGLIDAAGDIADTSDYNINVSGNYDLNQQGIYNISVCVVSALGVRTEENITLYVI